MIGEMSIESRAENSISGSQLETIGFVKAGQRFQIAMEKKPQFVDFTQLGMVDDGLDQMLGEVLSAKGGDDAKPPDFPDVVILIQWRPAQ